MILVELFLTGRMAFLVTLFLKGYSVKTQATDN